MINIQCITFARVESQTRKEDLADFVRRVRAERGLSYKEVEAAARREISSGYVWQIENRQAKNLTHSKLAGLAKGLGVPLEAILAVARGEKFEDRDAFQESRFAYAFSIWQQFNKKNRDVYSHLLEDLIGGMERRLEKQIEDEERQRQAEQRQPEKPPKLSVVKPKSKGA